MKHLTLPAVLIMFCTLVGAVENNLEDGLMARGYDVVAYRDQSKAVKGKVGFTTEHEGVKYRFANIANKAAFEADPKLYVPAYGGWCAYAMSQGDLANIHPERFKIIDGRIYLFYDGFWGNTLTKWNADEAALKPKADAEWKKRLAEK